MDENTQSEQTETTAPEVNESEQLARAQGWVPKEEWTGEGKWRDAESFLDRGELFAKIESQRREVKELRRNQQAFASHLETVRKAEFEKAITALRAEKRQALVDGDPDAVIAADEKIAVAREQIRQAAPVAVPEPTGPTPEFQAWNARNTWYNPTNPASIAMVAAADKIGTMLAGEVQAGRMTPEQVLQEVETQVRKEFPHKFTNPNRDRASAVEGAGKPASAKGEYQLDDMQRQVMNRLIKTGAVTKEQYIADLKAADARGR